MPDTIEPIPECLKEIAHNVHHSPLIHSNLDIFQSIWEDHIEKIKLIIPDICIESNGEALYLGDLSPGCRICKEGTWDCIFTTMECNLDCEFCLRPKDFPKSYAGSIFGAQLEEIAENHSKTIINGISLSGGEPFLKITRMIEWFTWFKNLYPNKYFWLYTNGLLADAESLQKLGNLGIDEIRFNLAATGYDHPAVMKNLALAVQYIPNVTVEIPAVPEHASKLLSSLSKWCELGVKFLNMHELIYEPGTNSETMSGKRKAMIFFDGHRSEISTESRDLTMAVMCKVYKDGLPLAVNDCSMQSKIRQFRGRRQCIAPLVRSDHENLIEGQMLESYCIYQGENVHFFHPNLLDDMRKQHPDYGLVRLVRTAPLSLKDPGRWITFEKL
jgi:pyruvate formate-lyase activating enzyme-like uncharacterized protein